MSAAEAIRPGHLRGHPTVIGSRVQLARSNIGRKSKWLQRSACTKSTYHLAVAL